MFPRYYMHVAALCIISTCYTFLPHHNVLPISKALMLPGIECRIILVVIGEFYDGVETLVIVV